ncbi:FecR domain-containing protein [Synechococcus sp. Tobar12-5m-g]|uniref:FecR domain-containing protein n=1 Tax=unclassified Synechococcus TaxID=2626047 RepID=UPI0020CFE7BF|nr:MULTISPECIES: FecR domain-containing protein [unclassified Synechococcus]MCP9772881.1 FecR domain-containing protein [Synechococcus sp. Tobar12-5m-g]MCP9873653.1 FecR domain-containing protein [Synechococcus sp. Cruz CV-v-12]
MQSPRRGLMASLRTAAASSTAAVAVLLGVAASAAPGVPRVVDVPTRPAFVTPPKGAEQAARIGQVLMPATLLRTQKPGRLQVLLADGRGFRLGGDALLRLGIADLDLQSGQIIAWIPPGRTGVPPLRVRTRVATASIAGTTVFIEATPTELKFFSWEGRVLVEADNGQRFTLTSGEQVTFVRGAWQAPLRLSPAEAATRRKASILLNGFEAPMETLTVIERELGLTP